MGQDEANNRQIGFRVYVEGHGAHGTEHRPVQPRVTDKIRLTTDRMRLITDRMRLITDR